jgi:hypothetical protein
MKPPWPKALLAVISIVGLAIVLSAVFRPREPVYQGKALSHWVDAKGQATRVPDPRPSGPRFGLPAVWGGRLAGEGPRSVSGLE